MARIDYMLGKSITMNMTFDLSIIYMYLSLYFTNSLPAKGAITDPTLAQKEENDIPEFLKLKIMTFFWLKKTV